MYPDSVQRVSGVGKLLKSSCRHDKSGFPWSTLQPVSVTLHNIVCDLHLLCVSSVFHLVSQACIGQLFGRFSLRKITVKREQRETRQTKQKSY